MNKFKYYFILIITSLSLFSCSKDDNSVEVEPLRDYGEQYAKDNDSIQKFLNTYYIEKITDAPGKPEDQDVKFTKIPTGGNQAAIMSYLNSTTFPKLLKKSVDLHEIKYEIYYLVLREGVGVSPCNVDGVFADYKGMLLNETVFDQSVFNPQGLFNLDGYTRSSGTPVITGWSEVFPEFRTGTYEESDLHDGTLVYNDFGAGVMFLPSGLAYYTGSGTIPAYTPILFSFKLYEVKRFDHDGDGIPDYQEDLNGDGYLRTVATTNNPLEDSDVDGVPDFLDIDDDGDGYTTKIELKKPDGSYHTFETVPSCSGQTTKRYLNANCKPPYLD